jgi:hypothetical protein
VKRPPPWLIWPLVGAVAGAVVIGLLAPALFLVDVIGTDAPWSRDEGPVVWALFAGIIGVVWGATGGLVAGVVCLGVTAVAGRWGRRSSRLHARTAAGVTASLVALVGIGPATDGLGAEQPLAALWDLTIWVFAPVGICAAVAYIIGGRVWTLCEPAEAAPALA